MPSLRSIRLLYTVGGMWASDPKSIGPWAWGREDADVTGATRAAAIPEVGGGGIPAGGAEEVTGEGAAIGGVGDSSRRVVIRARRKGPRPQMTLPSSTRCWIS